MRALFPSVFKITMTLINNISNSIKYYDVMVFFVFYEESDCIHHKCTPLVPHNTTIYTQKNLFPRFQSQPILTFYPHSSTIFTTLCHTIVYEADVQTKLGRRAPAPQFRSCHSPLSKWTRAFVRSSSGIVRLR